MNGNDPHYGLRPCLVKGKDKAFFHRWEERSKIVDPSPLRGGSPGGVIKSTFAIVEYEDGRVSEEYPYDLQFTDV